MGCVVSAFWETDIDIYNDTRNLGEPINMVPDLTNGVEELFS